MENSFANNELASGGKRKKGFGKKMSTATKKGEGLVKVDRTNKKDKKNKGGGDHNLMLS